jgi:Mg2+ transporter (mgtE)
MIRLSRELEKDLHNLLEGGDPSVIAERIKALPPERIAILLTTLHPADGAEVLEELDIEQQRAVFAELESEDAADVLSYLDSDDQVELVADLPSDELSEILDEMEPDDAADMLAELPPDQASAALEQMEDANEVKELLKYEDESAGGLMTPHVVKLRTQATVGHVLSLLRNIQPIEDLSYYLYVTDDDDKLVGVVSLRQLVTADLNLTLGEIMHRDVISVSVDADQEEAARIFSRYGLLSLPTVDSEGRLVGAITADDVIDVIQEEATEDIYHLAGLDAEEHVDESVLATARRRLTWLLVNLPTALLAGAVVSQFEGTVQKVAVLAVFMPIIAGMAGNAGIQTLTLIVRSIALGEISLRDSWSALSHELLVGLINGICFGALIGLVGLIWKGVPILGVIAGVAMLTNMVAAAFAGTMVPLILRRIGADPALASGVIVTTFTDVTGYTCFLGLATIFINLFPIS